LTSDAMTFMYELDPYYLEIYRYGKCRNEPPTPRLLEVIV